MIIKTRILAIILTILSGSALAGSINNGDFGTGDLTGWNATQNVSVVANGSGYAADLWAGLGQDVYSTVSQDISLNAGDTLSGWAQWFGHDEMPFNDNGFVKVDNLYLFFANISTFGDYGNSDVTLFSFTALTSGIYALSAGVANAGDNDPNFSSELKVGDFKIANASAQVPEPATFTLLSLGMLGFSAACKRKPA